MVETDLLGSPAYMAVPGNIYHTMLCGSGDAHEGVRACEMQPQPDAAMRDLELVRSWELKAGCVFLAIGAAIAVAWLVSMHREGY